MASSRKTVLQGPPLSEVLSDPQLIALDKWRLSNKAKPCDEKAYVARAKEYGPPLAAKLKAVLERIGS